MKLPTWLTRLSELMPADALSTWAVFGAACGLLAAVPLLPPLIKAVALGAFILLGPGSALLDRVPGLPPLSLRALVPVTGLSVVLLVVSGGLLLGLWSPRPILLALAVATGGVGWLNRRRSQIADPVLV